jgi:hypothetical protein
MQQTIDSHGLQPHPWFMGKVIELYEMIVVRCVISASYDVFTPSTRVVSIREGAGWFFVRV